MKFSFIVIARSKEECTPALESIRNLEGFKNDSEVLVAIGSNPSQQRNEAAKRASGDYLVFLDNDSRVHPSLLRYYTDALSYEKDIGIVGGPSVYDGRASQFKLAVHAVFSSVFGLGPFRARYTALGPVRATGEQELILCNLMVERKLFLESGGFNRDLYPNEENEFLNRIRKLTKMYYHPLAICYRDPRGDFASFVKQVFRYGDGRAKHMLLFRSVWNNIFLIPAIFSLYFFSLPIAFYLPTFSAEILLAPFALHTIFNFSASAFATLGHKKLRFMWVLPVLFLSCHVFYGLGFVRGLIRYSFLSGARGQSNAPIEVHVVKTFQSAGTAA